VRSSALCGLRAGSLSGPRPRALTGVWRRLAGRPIRPRPLPSVGRVACRSPLLPWLGCRGLALPGLACRGLARFAVAWIGSDWVGPDWAMEVITTEKVGKKRWDSEGQSRDRVSLSGNRTGLRVAMRRRYLPPRRDDWRDGCRALTQSSGQTARFTALSICRIRAPGGKRTRPVRWRRSFRLPTGRAWNCSRGLSIVTAADRRTSPWLRFDLMSHCWVARIPTACG
jgi:hypothetical protein